MADGCKDYRFLLPSFCAEFLKGGWGVERYAYWVEGRNGLVTLMGQFNLLNIGMCFHLK